MARGQLKFDIESVRQPQRSILPPLQRGIEGDFKSLLIGNRLDKSLAMADEGRLGDERIDQLAA